MRFYLDEDLSHRIAPIGRDMGLDIIATAECDRDGTPDEEQLRFAAEEGRVLVTRNSDDFHDLTNRFAAERRPHAGVLVVPRSLLGRDYMGIAAAIALYASEHPGEMPSYMVDYLRRVRI